MRSRLVQSSGTWRFKKLSRRFSTMDQPISCQIIPYLSVHDADAAISFYSKIFGVDPFVRLAMPDGRVMHCEFRVGTARFFLSDELPEHGGTPSPKSKDSTTVALHLYVENCDDMVQRMSEHGSAILMPPTDMFWGERFARVRDPFGHEWGVAQWLHEMSANEIQSAATELFKNVEPESE